MPTGSSRGAELEARPIEPDTAVGVLERWQGQGVGRALVGRPAGRACDEGIAQFTALMLSENWLRRLLAALATTRLVSAEAGAIEVAVDLQLNRPLPTRRF